MSNMILRYFSKGFKMNKYRIIYLNDTQYMHGMSAS